MAVGWLDLDGSKAANDIAGFAAGHDLIRSVGRSLTDAGATLDSVAVGHGGGDDFRLVTDSTELDALVEHLLDPPREARGVPISLSLATFLCTRGGAASYQEISRRLAAVKRMGKRL